MQPASTGGGTPSSPFLDFLTRGGYPGNAQKNLWFDPRITVDGIIGRFNLTRQEQWDMIGPMLVEVRPFSPENGCTAWHTLPPFRFGFNPQSDKPRTLFSGQLWRDPDYPPDMILLMQGFKTTTLEALERSFSCICKGSSDRERNIKIAFGDHILSWMEHNARKWYPLAMPLNTKILKFHVGYYLFVS